MSQQDTISVTYGSTQKRMWRIEPQEEYIWSMRFYKSIEEKTVDVAVSESGTEIARTSRNLSKSDIFNFTQPEKIQKQVKMFASFLPDETLLDVDDYTPREIECCLLYGRITGMHGLIERSHKMKADFKLKLTNQLNQFIGAMVQEILSNGGDILKFSPAAIVAIWKCTKGAYITQNVHIAIDCALVIQRQYGKFILESGEKLKVDFAITAGSVYFCLIGNEKCTKSVIFGAVYEDVRKARKMVALKNIIVSPKAMQFIHSFEYKLEQIEYGTFFQVIGLTKMWKQVRRNDYQDTASFHHLETVNTSFITINTTNVTTAETKPQGSFTEFCLRPIVQELVSYNGERFIANVQKFFDPGIRDAILADEPTDNLVELRDVIMVTILVVTSIAKSIKMLKATDDIFKKVERYAAKFEGYINYVSILDNSTMITIVFGLKSMAHVMQHRSALTCAFEIMGVLKYGPKISVVTIGLSTGKAYYTVVGHGLRQDISLFGKTITDAITLASKFNDKIVCDQDTFIHSRMKPSCFRLIKEREKSEMEDVLLGSVYELLTDDFDLLEELPVYDQPTIGRDKEISIYNKVCGKFFKKSRMKNHMKKVHNALYIKGYSKEGKSRLLHELIKVTSPNIPVHFIPLHNEDKDIPYFFVRKIFSIVFDCNLLSSTREDRKHELQLRLADMPKIDLRCSINPVFHVNFPETEDFWKFSSEEKFREMLKILKYLCKKVFAINWLIAVDDADRVDKESWRVLEALLETKTFFLVMTANRDHSLSAINQRNFSRNPNVVKLKIETLSPNYISAIVCQHFKVFAIPPELEYMLQKTSNGNIGFIKNVLTNLRHRSFFSFKEISYLEATENNMVIPSMNLIIPIPDSEKQSLMMFIAKKGKYDKNEFKRILWYLFVESFQNKKFIHMRDKVYEIVLKTKKFRVCYLVKEINMDLMPNDLTTNIQITQTFEMLSYPEQMILKCCSILGDTFSRMVIEHVLPLDYYNLLAPAVKSFFEMGILCCGRGDFSDGVQFLVYREKCQDPRFDDDMTCKCRGLYTQDRFKKLPTYAYCGLLRFKYSQFREIIYDQLREVQKVDFHAKVIIFLHEETKRCRACGRDSFDWDNQKRLDEYAKRRKQGKNKKRFSQRLEYDFDLMNTTFHELFYDELPFPHKGSMSSRTGSAVSLDYSYCRESEVPITLSQFFTIKKVFGPWDIKKFGMNISLVRSFSTSDFTYCDCRQILSAYYREMIIHCRGAGQFIRLLDNMQRYAYLCITNKNISEAHLILKQATGCINDIFEMENPPPKWKRKLFEAKILTISALAFKELGLLTEAEAHLKMAMEKFGVKFPRGRIGKLLSLAKVKLQKVLTFYAFPEMQTKTLNFCICEYNVNVAEALDLYAKFLMAKKQWEAAELVASWALYRALNAQTDFVRICDCFCNMILISIRAKNRSMNIALEVHALRYCYRKTNRIESWDLAAVCRLYSTIVVGKFIRAELDFSIHMGYIIIRMAACLNDTEKLLLISSYLVTVLMGKLYLQEAASLLLELEFCSENIDDLPGQIWFHSQALLFHMEIGYCIVPYQQCLSFMEIQANKLNDVTYNDAIKRLIILMWLWCLRNEQWERAARFDQYIKTTSDVHQGHVTIRTVLSLMYVLEGYLLLYVHKLNKSNINLARQYHKSVKSLLKLLEKESKFMVVLKSKLFALKAYYFFVKNDINKAFRWLQKSEKAAKKNGITLMEEWLKHTRKAWNNELPSKKKNFWKDHSGENNLVFYQEFDFNTDDIGFFTLPPPLYV